MTNVKIEMACEAWEYYKDMIKQLDPNAAVEVFTANNLPPFLNFFMVHQSAAYVFSTLCTPEQRVFYHQSVTVKLRDKGYDLDD